MNPQEVFLNMLVAAMADAAVEKKLTQLKTTIDPDGKGARTVRIIVVPEQMEYNWPEQWPAGSTPKAEDGQHRHGTRK